MTNDRRKILDMLAEGKINADDADRLLAKLQSDRPEDPSEEARPSAGQRPLKYLRVLVNSDNGDNVNIRVPMALVRTGLMLTTMIPVAASDELEKKGVDLSGLSNLDGNELVEALRELNVDVDSANGDTVRVFCE
ncbi:MAG: hypothetical protein V3R89_00530 [Thermoanaerobaculia bacterium]